jgi:hypothetical protein
VQQAKQVKLVKWAQQEIQAQLEQPVKPAKLEQPAKLAQLVPQAPQVQQV